MGLTVEPHGDLFCPLVRCDECGERICGQGIVHYGASTSEITGVTYVHQIRYVHKGKCDRDHEARVTNSTDLIYALCEYWGWDELDQFVEDLAANIRPR